MTPPFLVQAGARPVSQPPTPIGSLPVMPRRYAGPLGVRVISDIGCNSRLKDSAPEGGF